MRKSAALVAGCICLVAASVAILKAFPQVRVTGSAYAAVKKDYKHTLNLAGEQRMLSQRMSKEVLLVALGYNKRENLRNLSVNHDQFTRVLTGMRYGDPELALENEQDGLVVENLRRVEEIWPLFESALRESVQNGEVTRDGVGIIADLSLPLLQATSDTIGAYEDLAKRDALFSMLEIAVNQSGELRMLSQKMAKEFLLIAYNHEPARHRKELSASMEHFETVLEGLMEGDASLRLIPAPSPKLKAQIKAVERVYNETKQIFLNAVRGVKLNQDNLADVASLNLILLAEADRVVRSYEAF